MTTSPFPAALADPPSAVRPPAVARLSARARFAVAAVLSVVLVLATASAASAHAVVVSSQPGDRERLPSAPTEVSVTFSESVSPEIGGLSVLNAKGERVDRGSTTQPKPEVLQVGVQPDLPDGTYVTNYRIISADGHPVTGAIVFSVGTAIDEAGASSVKQQSSPAYEVLGAIGRFGSYLGGLAAAGLAFFAWFLHDQAPDRSRLPRLVVFGAAVGLVGQLVVVAAQSALASGSGLAAFFDPSVVTKVLGGSLGWATAVLVVGLVACVVAMKVRSVLVAQCLAFYGMVTVAVSYALWGHDIESEVRWLSVSSNVLHTATAALWFGGLVGLGVAIVGRSRAAERASVGDAVEAVAGGPSGGTGVAVLERVEAQAHTDRGPRDEPVGTPADTVGIVIRFSTLATVSIVLLGVAGTILAWLELGSVSALFSTTYGRTLLLKLVLVGGITLLAVYNHFRLLPVVLGEQTSDAEEAAVDDPTGLDPMSEPDDVDIEEPDFALPEWRRLVKTVRLEVIGMVAVLVVTAVLVNLTPGRTASGDLNTGPFSQTKAVGKGKVELVVSPAQAGSNAMHITYLSADNRAADLAQSVIVEMSLPDKGVGPLSRNATKAGVGHFVVLSTPDLSIAGTWTVTLVSRLSEFEQERTVFEVPISS